MNLLNRFLRGKLGGWKKNQCCVVCAGFVQIPLCRHGHSAAVTMQVKIYRRGSLELAMVAGGLLWLLLLLLLVVVVCIVIYGEFQQLCGGATDAVSRVGMRGRG
jgi:hypothetical protein